VSRLRPADALLILSVGGGDAKRKVSANIVAAIDYAKKVGAKVAGIVGRREGYTAQMADVCVVVPVANPATGTRGCAIPYSLRKNGGEVKRPTDSSLECLCPTPS